MQDLHLRTVRDIALEMPVTTRIFEEYKIDYCCHGDALFNDACRKAGASPVEVIQKISHVLHERDADHHEHLGHFKLSELIDHIVDKHHAYTWAEIEALTPLMAKVAAKHGDHNPNLVFIKDAFKQICDDLGPHMLKEEQVLFPYIKQIESSVSGAAAVIAPPFGTVANPVRMMRMEHEEVGELLARMSTLSNRYTVPTDACPSFTALYHRLAALEVDLHRHIHLENNLLFPQAVELEQMAFQAIAA